MQLQIDYAPNPTQAEWGNAEAGPQITQIRNQRAELSDRAYHVSRCRPNKSLEDRTQSLNLAV